MHSGWLVINKPEGITSAHVVAKIKRFLRNLTGEKVKVGHAGTLDPFASGVLPIAIGEATKTADYISNSKKTYRFRVKFGIGTDTDDKTGKVIATGNIPSSSQIEKIISEFTGEIEQIPPKYSAIHIDGKRAYDLARMGEDFEIKSRKVYVYGLAIVSYHSLDEVELYMECSKGTYVRALARDMGISLGTFAHVTELFRDSVGKFLSKNAISLENLEKIVHIADFLKYLHPIEAVLDDIPVIKLQEKEVEYLKNGRIVSFQSSVLESKVLVMGQDYPAAICEYKEDRLKPVRVFNF